MKSLPFLLLLPLAASAQRPLSLSPAMTAELVRSGVIMVLLYLLSSFILAVLRVVLDYLLKKQLLAAGATESLVAQLLPRRPAQPAALRWFALLTALAGGLLLGSFYQPWGVQSAVILLFSLALGFLGYYFLLRRLAE